MHSCDGYVLSAVLFPAGFQLHKERPAFKTRRALLVGPEGTLFGGLLRLAATLGRCSLQCTRFARLHIVATAAHFLEDPGLHDLLLERLERPIDLVTFVKLYFNHQLLPEKGRNGW